MRIVRHTVAVGSATFDSVEVLDMHFDGCPDTEAAGVKGPTYC